jgi:hypothetical protein
MRSHPQLPLATPEENPEVIIRKGKPSQGEIFATEPGISPPPSVKTPFSCSQLPSHRFSEVSRFLNFGSVPAEFSPPGLVSEREILITPPSLEDVPQHRPRASEGFTTSLFITTTAQGETSANSSPLALSLYFPRCLPLLQGTLFRYLLFTLLLLQALLYLILPWLALIPL